MIGKTFSSFDTVRVVEDPDRLRALYAAIKGMTPEEADRIHREALGEYLGTRFTVSGGEVEQIEPSEPSDEEIPF